MVFFVKSINDPQGYLRARLPQKLTLQGLTLVFYHKLFIVQLTIQLMLNL